LLATLAGLDSDGSGGSLNEIADTDFGFGHESRNPDAEWLFGHLQLRDLPQCYAG
jgi:hypothetical protein